MKTQTIEVEGLPEGFEVNTISINAKERVSQCFNTVQATIHLKKIQPRRIVLESTTESRKAVYGDWIYNNGIIEQWRSQNESQSTYRIWREVKETNEEPYLKLNKKDMLELIEHIKLDGQLNPKISEFIDYDQPEPKLGLSVDECKAILSSS